MLIATVVEVTALSTVINNH